ncbi:uncharacterized protein FIESC28_07355 [Fusarium coffeatum]|uniref:Uncharacterized protein n=1 Tax=Fusarium coffeatum TaxID=231269 RepID=A0A366RGC2_9HYPO|nr:uncharacterized protein FIESC28_07355 [Fusarium coffeatum]RBR15420.1 hypothetical protein FIESC28_07355 [Fusarium coffeatum]
MGAKVRERAGPVAIQIPNAAEYGSIHFILKFNGAQMSSGPNHQKKSPDSSGEALLDPCLAPFNRHPWQSTLAIPYCCSAGEGTLYNIFVPEAEAQGYIQGTPWRDGYVSSTANDTIGISLCLFSTGVNMEHLCRGVLIGPPLAYV